MEQSGYLYKKKNSDNWYMGYSVDGRPYQRSTGTPNKTDARRILNAQLKRIAEGRNPSLAYQKTKFDELARDILTDYKVNGRKTIVRIEQSIAHLSKSFKGMRASRINTAMIKDYISMRLDEGAANGTINRELTALKRMFNLGLQSDKINTKPHIQLLQENNAREGFLEYEQFLILRDHLPEHLQPLVTVAFMTGLRRGELTSIEWNKVFLDKGYLRLGPLDTKNKRPRTVYLNNEALEALRTARKSRRPDCNLVFHRDGRRISDFRNAWNKAREAAGVEGLVFHDLRRSAIRNMVRAGIPEQVAMSISGHRTRIIFDRYNIVSEKDLQEAAKMLDKHLKSQDKSNLSKIPERPPQADHSSR